LTTADLISDLRELGLRRSINPEQQPELAGIILNARHLLQKTLAESQYQGYFAAFDPAKFNEQASLAENLLFGTPVGSEFVLTDLAAHPHVRATLTSLGLWPRFVDLGAAVARSMLEIFDGLPPGHPILVKYSFVDGQELADYEAAVTRRHRPGVLDMLSEEEQVGIVSILLRLVPARHRLDEIDDQIRSDIMAARVRFAETLPDDARNSIEFYDPERYNRTASLRDNLLFGRVAPGQEGPGGRIRQVVLDALREAGQLEKVLGAIVEVGLTYHAGVGGARLAPDLRQKVALARALLKRPDLLVLNDPFGSIDLGGQTRLIESVFAEAGERAVIWTLQRPSLAKLFGTVVVIDNGRIVDQGSFEEIEARSELFQALVRSE
jgi:ABC-type phosphate transport system ATPase subunit